MNRPPLTFEINDIKIKMTYGLQMDLQRLVPDATQAVDLIMEDPYLRDFVLRRALTNSPKSIKEEDNLIKPEELEELDPDHLIDLLDWITGHLMYFFVKSASNLARHGADMKEVLDRLTPSQTGSTPSASETPPAGPSELSKES